MFCEYCGAKLNEQHNVCPHCGAPITKSTYNNQGATKKRGIPAYIDGMYSSKSRLIAILLAFLIGSFGVHNFYLGHKEKAIKQLLWATLGSLIFVGPIIAYFWSIYDLIVYLLDSNMVDGEGKRLITISEEATKLKNSLGERK